MTLLFIALGIIALILLYQKGQYILTQERIIKGKTIQLFESLQLIDSTVNTSVFINRIQMALGITAYYSTVNDVKLLTRGTRKGSDCYRRMYPTIELTHSQSFLFEKASNIAGVEYISERTRAFFIRFCIRKQEEIDKLKTNAAKDRRRNEVNECLSVCRRIMQEQGIPYTETVELDNIAQSILG